ncbi:MAG: ABC transporter permease, partial [Candidatus Marinimicrobia bacterium]|nr:ABC transporter permease [Candidatus Neomarinimicrobiota bacterium]
MSTIILLAILIPFLSPYSDDLIGAVHLEINNQGPSLSHFFGTDAAGRDMFTLTLRGGLVSIRVAIGVVLMSVVLGAPLGFIAGVSGKKLDEIIMRISD